MQTSSTASHLRRGMLAGIPIALGYFACSIALGIQAAEVGIGAAAALLAGLCLNASAGGYAFFTSFGSGAGIIECALLTAVANARYFLMACAMGQKLERETGLLHRMAMGFDLTDELFSVSIAAPGPLSPAFYYGMMLVSMPAWAVGSFVGAKLGAWLPPAAVASLGMALYGMFLTSIIPAARRSRVLLLVVSVSMLASLLFTLIPLLSALSEGMRTVILTVALSALFALLFPRKEDEEATV